MRIMMGTSGSPASVRDLPTVVPDLWVGSGAAWGTRTHDPIITNDVLYQLS